MTASERIPTSITVLRGDQTGDELLIESLRTLDRDVTGVPLEVVVFDLSLLNRRKTKNGIVFEAAESMKETGLGLKAATITPEIKGDVGSPNAILRREINGQVILRTGRRLPGVNTLGVNAPISVVRMAVGDAYDAEEWREKIDGDEVAYRTETIKRSVCHAVAEFSFLYAKKVNAAHQLDPNSHNAEVFGGPKYTVSHDYEGMLKEELDEAAKRYPDVVYNPQLIDATYALIVPESVDTGRELVIPALNRDGDCLSDLVLSYYGTIAGSESILFAFDERFQPNVVMAEAPHGTAPKLFGKNIANPTAMILAGASLLSYIPTEVAQRASIKLRESVLSAIHDGIKTNELGGDASMTEFTDEVIYRMKQRSPKPHSHGN